MYIFREMHDHQWKVFSEMFTPNDPIGQVIQDCHLAKNLSESETEPEGECDEDRLYNVTTE